MPDPVTTQGQEILGLWQGAWIAALATGVLVWGLILGSAFVYRRRSDDEIPIQTRYNLPVEIFYTIFPIIMVIVFFSHTVRVQNVAIDMVEDPDVNIVVVGQKWQWTFNYPESGPQGENVFFSGTGDDIAELWLPVDSTIQFDLFSPDVVHNFGIPAFAMRMDVIPGDENENAFQVKTTEEGTFAGKCYELCGTYHSRMLFEVHIVSQEEYDAYLAELAEDPDHVTDEPILGGKYDETPVLDDLNQSEGEQE
jgi:cytochrome c oxidase subunit 2